MLEKFITNLKNSLPGSKGKQAKDEDGEDVDATDEGISDEEAAKKNQVSMIIRVVVILAIAYFVVDEFVLKDSTPKGPSVEELAAATPRKKKKVEVKKNVTSAESTPTEAQSDVQPDGVVSPSGENISQVGNNPGSEPKPEEITADAPIENVNVLDKGSEPGSMDLPSEPEIVESKIDQLIDKVDKTPTVPEKESNAGIGETALVEEVKIPSQPVDPSSEKKPADSMTSKIAEDEPVETPPPQYDNLGRGLVYNCKDKYWACVDKPSYVICNKNMKWNQSKGKSAECSVQAIYNSEEDCAKVQKYNVNTSQATAFCQN